MKSYTSFGLLLAGIGALACSEPPGIDRITAGDHAAPGAAAHGERGTYDVIQLGSLGGTASRANSNTNRGSVAGFSHPAGNATVRATLWQDGEAVDLGTLGGPNSSVLWPGQNERGMIVGIAETAALDSLGQSWSCSFFFPAPTGHVCAAFVWQDGDMRALPTLGGQNGFATGINNRGQIVGWAENTVADTTCNPPQVRQFRAVLWGPREDQFEELPPFGDGTTSAATAINERGQVVGISGICANAVGDASARHAVIWENGVPRDLGDLGGLAWNTPMDINDRGDVVGFALHPGQGALRAVFWPRGESIRHLGTLVDNTSSQALSINARRQIVGVSHGGTASMHAFIWQDDVMTDLNDLAPGYDGVLVDARHINDHGVITGWADDAATGDRVAFIATPVR